MLRGLEACPRHLLVCEKSSFLHEKSRHSALVQSHYYNCSVSLLLPECASLPEHIKRTVDNFGRYYLVRNLPLHEFVKEDFINTFVKKGKLILSVDKDTYEELGLQGKPSLYSGKNPLRYIIKIDLTEEGLAPGGKKFQRLNWAFTEKKPLKCDFLLAWDNTGAPSILSYFCKYTVKECNFKITSRISRDLPCPVLKSGDLHGKPEESCSSEELFDWLGAVSNSIDCDNDSSNFISAFCCPHPNTMVERAHLCTINGFVTPENIQRLLDQLREYFAEPKLTQWVSLIVHGFADSPVSWKECEHGFFKGGENLYSVVVFNNQDYWLQMAVGTHDGCPP
uniref:Ribonuclease P/MRP 40kDa subunit n=1 Tax=Xenopus tropicalis TaxID=8364 RepID=F6U311_XENTR